MRALGAVGRIVGVGTFRTPRFGNDSFLFLPPGATLNACNRTVCVHSSRTLKRSSNAPLHCLLMRRTGSADITSTPTVTVNRS